LLAGPEPPKSDPARLPRFGSSSSHSQKAFRVHEWRQSREGIPSSHRDGPRGGLRNWKRLR
ncbi:hypothetical protein T06_16378, partial [Trichinella sp. T6]